MYWTRRGFIGGVSGIVATSVAGCSTRSQEDEGYRWAEFQRASSNQGFGFTEGPVEDAEEAWTREIGSRLTSSPVVADGTVFVGSDDNRLYALDASTGDEQWTFETGGSVAVTPGVRDGSVYVTSYDDTIYAVDAEAGEEQWSVETGGGLDMRSSPKVLGNEGMYVGASDGRLYALEHDGGGERWVAEIGDGVLSTPALTQDLVVIGARDRVVAVDRDTGESLWEFTVDSGRLQTDFAAPTVGSYIYVGSDTDGLYALDPSTGTIEWNYDGPSMDTSPVIGDRLYVASADGNLYGLSEADGTEQFVVDAGFKNPTSGAMVEDAVYVGDRFGLGAFDSDSGEQLWAYETDGWVRPPAVSDGTLFLSAGPEVIALAAP